jgi:hypothetical protein
MASGGMHIVCAFHKNVKLTISGDILYTWTENKVICQNDYSSSNNPSVKFCQGD